MNRERAKELLPIIQAFAEGKDIQWRRCDNFIWQTYTGKKASVLFAAEGGYRVKPKPFECWVNVYGENDAGTAYGSREDAEAVKPLTHDRRTVHMREVEQ